MYTIQFADLKRVQASKSKNRVVRTADKLTFKGSIEKVKQQEALIYKVQTNEYWEEADIFDHEKVRQALHLSYRI
jgi:type I restriction enzyme R subunit